MGQGPGTHQRHILQVLHEHGWCWMTDLPAKSRSDASAYHRAASRLAAKGLLRIEHRRRSSYLRTFTLLVSVTQFSGGTAIPLDEPFWPEEDHA